MKVPPTRFTMRRMTMIAFLSACARAIVGAIAGFVVVGLIVLFATDRFQIGDNMLQSQRTKIMAQLIGVGAILGAIVAALYGTVKIEGRSGLMIKGMALGGLGGVVVGPILAAFCTMGGTSYKSVGPIGLLVGVPLGIILGAILGAERPGWHFEESPLRPSKGSGSQKPDDPNVHKLVTDEV
jgi:MFS family permease